MHTHAEMHTRKHDGINIMFQGEIRLCFRLCLVWSKKKSLKRSFSFEFIFPGFVRLFQPHYLIVQPLHSASTIGSPRYLQYCFLVGNCQVYLCIISLPFVECKDTRKILRIGMILQSIVYIKHKASEKCVALAHVLLQSTNKTEGHVLIYQTNLFYSILFETNMNYIYTYVLQIHFH